MGWGWGPTHVRCTWAQIPPWGFGVYFQEPEEALPEDSPAFRVAAAAFSVLGDGQLAPGHLTGKGHTIQLPNEVERPRPGLMCGEAAPPSA